MTEEEKGPDLTVASLDEGAAIRLVDEALAKAIENICDPNTPPKEPRVVTLKIKLKSDEQREIVQTEITCDLKLANEIGVLTRLMLVTVNGKVIPSELVCRQTNLEDYIDEGNVTPFRKTEGDNQ